MTLLHVELCGGASADNTDQGGPFVGAACDAGEQNHAFYTQVMKAYRTDSPLVVTQHEYRVLSRLSAAYLLCQSRGRSCPAIH
jgi:hypothetical protein